MTSLDNSSDKKERILEAMGVTGWYPRYQLPHGATSRCVPEARAQSTTPPPEPAQSAHSEPPVGTASASPQSTHSEPPARAASAPPQSTPRTDSVARFAYKGAVVIVQGMSVEAVNRHQKLLLDILRTLGLANPGTPGNQQVNLDEDALKHLPQVLANMVAPAEGSDQWVLMFCQCQPEDEEIRDHPRVLWLEPLEDLSTNIERKRDLWRCIVDKIRTSE